MRGLVFIVTIVLSLPFSVTAVVAATEWHVVAGGSSNPDGKTKATAWDLKTALENHDQSVKPGDTILVHGGGEYSGPFLSCLEGTPDEPINVRQAPGERVSLVGPAPADPFKPILTICGNDTNYWDFEITGNAGDLRCNETDPENIPLPYGLLLGKGCHPCVDPQTNPDVPKGVRIKLINLVIHDVGMLGFWEDAKDLELYGSILYHIGWESYVCCTIEVGQCCDPTDASCACKVLYPPTSSSCELECAVANSCVPKAKGSGPAIYTNNGEGRKLFEDNIIFSGFADGIQASSGGDTPTDNYVLTGNTIFNIGILSNDGRAAIQIAEPKSTNNLVASNYVYGADPNEPGIGGGVIARGHDAVIVDNYFHGAVTLGNFEQLYFLNNTVVQPGHLVQLETPAAAAYPPYAWNSNTYSWGQQSGTAPFYVPKKTNLLNFTQWKAVGYDSASTYSTYSSSTELPTRIFVEPNRYAPGRANITIFNWEKSASVPVDVSGVLQRGDEYELRDAQNYFGAAVAEGTYCGLPINVPMGDSGADAAQPLGTGLPKQIYEHTEEEFGAFVLLVTGHDSCAGLECCLESLFN